MANRKVNFKTDYLIGPVVIRGHIETAAYIFGAHPNNQNNVVFKLAYPYKKN